jgi:polysaccharide biosynthesis PFTS motif protein
MRNDRVRRVTLDPPLPRWSNRSSDVAFAHVEHVYAAALASSRLIRILVNLYGTEQLQLAFKKKLVEGLVDFLYANWLIARFATSLGPVREVLVILPDSGLIGLANVRWLQPICSINSYRWFHKLAVQTGLPIQDTSFVRFPRWARIMSTGNDTVFRLYLICSLVYTLLQGCWKALNARHGPRTSGVYRICIAIVSPLREFANPVRGPDFLVDGKLIRLEEVLHVQIARLTPTHLAELEARGIRVAPRFCPPSWTTMMRVFRHVLQAGVALLVAPTWSAYVAVFLVRTYIVWKGFARWHRLKEFVTFGPDPPPHIGRNIILGQAGVRTWYYNDARSYSDEYVRSPKEEGFRHPSWGYLLYDTMVVWSDRLARYFKLHHQDVKRYVEVGCLWAEHVRHLKDSGRALALRAGLKEAGWREGQKIVSVFPTWYHDEGLFTRNDLMTFLSDIGRLLEDFPDIFVIVKEKAPRWLLPGQGPAAVYRVFEELARHPRCIAPGSARSVSEIAAQSDLVVGFPFSSVPVEAISARIPAIFHDATSKFRGTYYDWVPGLVPHGYEEFRRRVRQILYEQSAEDYERYLETEVKDHVDPFMDGRGLTRFRELLLGDETGEQVARRKDIVTEPRS